MHWHRWTQWSSEVSVGGYTITADRNKRIRKCLKCGKLEWTAR